MDLLPIIKPAYQVPRVAKVLGLDGSVVGEVELPPQFSEPVRRDLILRAYLSALSARFQPKGTDPMAGMRSSAESFGVGLGIARVPRIKGSLWPRARIAPNTVKGRRAHPPKVEKILHEEINRKERRKAIRSAIAATAIKELVMARGHVVNIEVPIVVVNDIEDVDNASRLRRILRDLNLWGDIERASDGLRIRAGRGKMRGRRYKEPRSLLLVAKPGAKVLKVARNFPGVDAVGVSGLSVLHLAPGGVPGRLTLWTLNSIEELRRGLFMG